MLFVWQGNIKIYFLSRNCCLNRWGNFKPWNLHPHTLLNIICMLSYKQKLVSNLFMFVYKVSSLIIMLLLLIIQGAIYHKRLIITHCCLYCLHKNQRVSFGVQINMGLHDEPFSFCFRWLYTFWKHANATCIENKQ